MAVALVVGVLAAGLYVLRVHAAALNREALTMALQKLLGARNPARALKLTKAAPNSPLCGGMEAVLVACRERKRPERAQADYRQGALDDSPDAVIAWLRGEYDEAFVRVAKRFTALRLLAVVAAVIFTAVAGLAAFALSDSIGFVLAATIALLIVAHAMSVDRRVHRDRKTLFEALADALYETAFDPQRFAAEPPPLANQPPPVNPKGIPRLVLAIRESGQPGPVIECATEVVKIGRDVRAHVLLDSERVSRMHAVVERTRDETTIIDLGSSEGTFVNGKRVDKCTLHDGDVVRIGDVELLVAFPEPVGRGEGNTAFR